MQKYQTIHLLSEEIYTCKDISALLKKYKIKESEEIANLFHQLKMCEKPVKTSMITIYCQPVPNGPVTRRVYLPLEDIHHNPTWFPIANMLCELICGEKIWDSTNYIIEKDGTSSAELTNTIRFEDRLDEMIALAIEKYPEKESQFIEFKEKVYYLKNNIFRYILERTDLSAIIGVSFLHLSHKEINDYLNTKKQHPQWLSFAQENMFYYINGVAETIADLRASNGDGFWMDVNRVYCL